MKYELPSFIFLKIYFALRICAFKLFTSSNGDGWTVGQLDSWTVGQLDSWTVGQENLKS